MHAFAKKRQYYIHNNDSNGEINEKEKWFTG